MSVSGGPKARIVKFLEEPTMACHETLRANRKVAVGSDRNFGLAFALIFFVIAVWPLLRHGEAFRWWALVVSLAFGATALVRAQALGPLNRLWFKLGLAMHSVMSPVLMGVLFFGAVTPMAFILRAIGKDILRLKPSDAPSYWIPREPPGPARNSMKQQF